MPKDIGRGMNEGYLSGKVIALSGGTGSFGRTFTRMVLDKHHPKTIRIISRGEVLQDEMEREFGGDKRLRFFLRDVRDKDGLIRAFDGADVVVHAAALKIAPKLEYSPWEAVQTNIIGTANVVTAALQNKVECVLGISTDKAVRATTLYGATKAVAERLLIQGNVGRHSTHLSCVRYGNFIGSRGSVVPLFLSQKEQGCFTITDERMTRFWLTKEDGVQFAIDCLERMHGGEIFVPKIPCARVTSVADAIAPDVPRKLIGIRPGERLSETLITEEEARHTREFDTFYVIDPEMPYWGYKPIEGGKSLPDGFEYASNSVNDMLSAEELKEKLKSCL